MMKKHIMFLPLLLCWLVLPAQPRWEGGVWLGGSGYLGDLNPSRYPVWQETQPVWGALAKYRFSNRWALRTQFMQGNFAGSDLNASSGSSLRTRGYFFSSRFAEFGFSVEWSPWLKRDSERQDQPFWLPLFRVGAGAFWMAPQVRFPQEDDFILPENLRFDLEQNKSQVLPGLVLGPAWNMRLSRTMHLGLDLNMHYQRSDYLDGVSRSGNPGAKDWLLSSGLSLRIRPYPKDRDDDGIPDKEDACPGIAGTASARGCPDRDGDGVEDAEDACPDQTGLMEFSGCPDTDGDGLMDKADLCPFEFGYEETKGCPDQDFDCVMDSLDRCPEVEGLLEFEGCPDTDGDGIPDPDDACPEEAGLPEHDGCALPDTDCDGILDRDDLCPHTPDTLGFTGCPDTDGDGWIDPEDCCPNEPGIDSLQGCPELKAEEKKLLEKAMREVRFKTGSAVLLPASLTILNQIVELVEKYPAFYLEIRGHTDSQGKAAFNMALSKKRAKACYDYLAAKGIDPARMQWEGFGAQKPLRENKTPQGRAVNRRVEFELFLIREIREE